MKHGSAFSPAIGTPAAAQVSRICRPPRLRPLRARRRNTGQISFPALPPPPLRSHMRSAESKARTQLVTQLMFAVYGACCSPNEDVPASAVPPAHTAPPGGADCLPFPRRSGSVRRRTAHKGQQCLSIHCGCSYSNCSQTSAGVPLEMRGDLNSGCSLKWKAMRRISVEPGHRLCCPGTHTAPQPTPQQAQLHGSACGTTSAPRQSSASALQGALRG